MERERGRKGGEEDRENRKGVGERADGKEERHMRFNELFLFFKCSFSLKIAFTSNEKQKAINF